MVEIVGIKISKIDKKQTSIIACLFVLLFVLSVSSFTVLSLHVSIVSAQTQETLTSHDIFVNGSLSAGYDMGVNSSGNKIDWLSNATTDYSMRMSYPSGQVWGAVFITVGKPVQPPRPWKNFSAFQNISFELRGQLGGESVGVGLKDASDADNGAETKVNITNLGTYWSTYEFNLSSFKTANLTQLYVVLEFVFSGASAQTVYFRNVKYLSNLQDIPEFTSVLALSLLMIGALPIIVAFKKMKNSKRICPHKILSKQN